jgi:hypothetical protein
MNIFRRMLTKLASRSANLGSQRGFSLTEVLVAGVVLVIGLIAISQFFASAMARVVDSDMRSVLHQVATQELESIRGLPYDEVGTTTGHPQGALAEDEYRQVGNTTVLIHRDVIYWSDDAYEGPFPLANYRRVAVTVSAVTLEGSVYVEREGIDPVELVSNVAGGAGGATLLVHVVNMAGDPVSEAKITVENTHLNPDVNIDASAIKTNDQGQLFIPGLVPDSSGYYFVEATKFGYSSDSWSDGPLVDSSLQEITLTIDKTSRMTIRVVDGAGDPVIGAQLSVTGPQSFTRSATIDASTAAGWTLSDLRFSTSDDPYVVTLLAGADYVSEAREIVLLPDTTQEVVFTVNIPEPTTTSTEAPTTTTDPLVTTTTDPLVTTTTSTSTTSTSSTTSTTVKGSLHVTVWGWVWKGGSYQWKPFKNASVSIGGSPVWTNDKGEAFFDNLVVPATYTLVVKANHHEDYVEDITITGAATKTVNLQWDW